MLRFTLMSKLPRQGTALLADNEPSLISHQLMLSSGLLVASSLGVFSYSPAFLRSVEKFIHLIDHKMTEMGGQKCQFPVLGKSALWKRSGRWENFGGEMFRLRDRANNSYCLQPTHEEEVCTFIKSLGLGTSAFPLRVYQITSKFRDEIQPKLGLLRCREFIMKDMYSFDLDLTAARTTYDMVCRVYTELFTHLQLPFNRVEAEGGLMGNCKSDEFHIPLAVGEDTLMVCRKCGKARIDADPEGCTCHWCGSDCDRLKSVEVAHCFLLGSTYTSAFDVKAHGSKESKVLEMGCYGIGVTRLLATALEHFTKKNFSKDPNLMELRWPRGLSPYCGAIALQKKTAKDDLSTEELERLLACFTVVSPTAVPTITHGDILLDERHNLSIGRKLVDLRRLGIPWVLIAKSKAVDINFGHELVDVYRGESFCASLQDVVNAFAQNAPTADSTLRPWHHSSLASKEST